MVIRWPMLVPLSQDVNIPAYLLCQVLVRIQTQRWKYSDWQNREEDLFYELCTLFWFKMNYIPKLYYTVTYLLNCCTDDWINEKLILRKCLLLFLGNMVIRMASGNCLVWWSWWYNKQQRRKKYWKRKETTWVGRHLWSKLQNRLREHWNHANPWYQKPTSSPNSICPFYY